MAILFKRLSAFYQLNHQCGLSIKDSAGCQVLYSTEVACSGIIEKVSRFNLCITHWLHENSLYQEGIAV